MAACRPFRGVRFRLAAPEDASPRIAPPYDVITPAEQADLLRQHPHNIVRLELPPAAADDPSPDARYARAARLYREWLAAGVLTRNPRPCLYLYGQRYATPGGPRERLGVLAALEVQPYEAGVVLPHEQTFPKHKEDRYRLLTAARAQFSPIFGLYSAPAAGVRQHLAARTAAPPAAVARDREGVEHRLWPVDDPEFAAWFAGTLADRQVFIADGHHRYETALRHREEQRAKAPDAPPAWFDYVMTFLVEMDDPGLVLLPTHRMLPELPLAPETMLRRLEPFFAAEACEPEEAAVLQRGQIGVVLPGGAARRLTLRHPRALEPLAPERSAAWRELEVAVLHRLVFRELLRLPEGATVLYTRDAEEAVRRAQAGEVAAFLLPPPPVAALKQVAAAGDKMPEKSTYFWPKAVTGLVVYDDGSL